ncbi:hypothetical protein [Spiroplasma floricola]|uniref:Uncharacterized protein n=1 Tax=Spiroplasma floricola 23-6 TaxID=1336749 RepID=A0A2K8SCV2_9MOLU|nr:hypothetical protein [Spiroplasma floricola]AUB31272.1 hypothetical protein SFLOR_v1c02110 [Spiroplasma floricola 23-6]
MGQSLLSRLLFGNQDPEKVAKYNAHQKWINSKQYRDLEWQREANNEAKKLIRKILLIKKLSKSNSDKSKVLWNKFCEKEPKYFLDTLNGFKRTIPERERWGCDKKTIENFKKGYTSLKIYHFNMWLSYEILRKDKVYEWIMSPRTKNEFEKNNQEWIENKYSPWGYKLSEKEKNKREINREKDFDYLKYLKEQFYIPLLIKKQIQFGVYNLISKEICHSELKQVNINSNEQVEKQLKLLKRQQEILDRQIELEKLKDRNNNRG